LLGALLLVSAFVSFGFLPVQLGGVVLLIVSAVFFLAELKHPGIGLPMVGGIIALVFGGLLLFNSSVPNATVSPWVVGTVAIGAAAFFGIVVSAVVRARRAPVVPYGNVVGQIGVALTDLDPSGQVRAGHEQWKAESTGDRIPKGASVRVLRREGLRLVVEPYEGAGAEAASLSGGGTDGVVITETAARLGGGREGE
jgi:membrane-bound serine protease (ClpP class)